MVERPGRRTSGEWRPRGAAERAGIPSARPPLGTLNRITAGILAVIWLAGGLVATGFGLIRHHWPSLILGPIAVGYGALWVHVARTGRWLNRPRQ